jgi:hypothetical protein
MELMSNMRKLWSDHVVWTRLYIISEFASLPDKEFIAKRLLKNQKDIGNALKPYFGEQVGNQVSQLLTEHIIGATKILTAMKTNNRDLRIYLRQWYTNGNQIADALHSINPTVWDTFKMRMMIKEHLDSTVAEATARLNKQWEADIRAYDKVFNQAMQMADMLSNGILMKNRPKRHY